MSTADLNRTIGEEAIEHVNQKYGREFTPLFFEDSDILSTTRMIQCHTDGLDPENERVNIAVFRENGAIRYADNYFSYIVRPEAEAYIAGIVGKEFDEFKVYRSMDDGTMPEELTADSTLEDLYRAQSNYWMKVMVYVRGSSAAAEDEYREKLARIEQTLLLSGHNYTMYLFVVSDEVYQAIERYEQRDFWDFYAENKTPDGKKYFWTYRGIILDGEVMDYGRTE